jgi:hypothetical protein
VLLPPHFRSIVQGIEFRFSVGPNIHFSEISLLFCSLGDRSERLKVQVELLADFYLPVKTRHCAARFIVFYYSISLVAISASISLNPDLLRAAGVCLHVDLFASVCIDDLERGRRIIQSHRLDLGIDREGVSDG